MVYGTTFLEAYGQELLPTSVFTEADLERGITYEQMMDVYYECWYSTEYICSLNESVAMLNEAQGYTVVNEKGITGFFLAIKNKFKKFIDAVKRFFAKLIQKIKDWFAKRRENANKRRDKAMKKDLKNAIKWDVVSYNQSVGRFKLPTGTFVPKGGDAKSMCDWFTNVENWDKIAAYNNESWKNLKTYTDGDASVVFARTSNLDDIVPIYNENLKTIQDATTVVDTTLKALSNKSGGADSPANALLRQVGLTTLVRCDDGKLKSEQYSAVLDYMKQAGTVENKVRKAVESKGTVVIKKLEKKLKSLESKSIKGDKEIMVKDDKGNEHKENFTEQEQRIVNYGERLDVQVKMAYAKIHMRIGNEFIIPMVQTYYRCCENVYNYVQLHCPNNTRG